MTAMRRGDTDTLSKKKTSPTDTHRVKTENRHTLPFVLQRKQVYILPTRYGFLFLLMLLTMLAGSLNYNNNPGFLLSFLLGSMALVSTITTSGNLAGLRILGVQCRPVFAGEDAVFELIVESTDNRAAISFRFDPGRPVMTDIAANGRHRVQIRVPAPRRGFLVPGDLIVFSRYPFGLFRSWVRFSPDIRCLVYPRVLAGPYEPQRFPGSRSEGGESSGQGVEDFKGLRSYQPGDAPQHISWKAFSRGQGLLTKEFVGGHGDVVLLDWDRVDARDVERKLSRLCDMVLKAHAAGVSYGLQLPDRRIGPAAGSGHREVCLTALATFGIVENGAS